MKCEKAKTRSCIRAGLLFNNKKTELNIFELFTKMGETVEKTPQQGQEKS